MKPEELNQLLYEEEGPTLDFKRDQYPFSKATDEEKSELLKDILGFVNCRRRAEAFILIGVEDVRGGRSIVYGVADHLHDHSLQQFVNNLTNRPIVFRYEACELDGKQVGIIRIEQQRRPVFLKRDYGKLKKGEVYVRRGSSTDPTKPADPDEIAMMGTGYVATVQEASLAVEFAALDHEQSLGKQVEWSAELCNMPEPKDIPMIEERPRRIDLPGGGSFQLPTFASLDIHSRNNDRYYHKLAEYELVHRLFRKIRLVISNIGDVPASDVRIEIVVPAKQGVLVVDSSDIPDIPNRRESAFEMDSKHFKVRRAIRNAGDVEIDTNDHRMKVEIDCGNLQPGRKIWSDTFWMGISHTGEFLLSGHLFASNLSEPHESTLTINATVSQSTMTLEQLLSLDDPVEEDEP